MARTLIDFKRGERLAARRLNEIHDAVRELQTVEQPQKRESVDQLVETPEVDEEWIFSAKTTRTERLEDADDPTVFIDVEVTTSVVVTTPDGRLISIQLE